MTYRMVIGYPPDPAFPVAQFWYEQQDHKAPWYRFWQRSWRRISPKQKMHLRDPRMAGARIQFSCEAEMYHMQNQLEAAQDASA